MSDIRRLIKKLRSLEKEKLTVKDRLALTPMILGVFLVLLLLVFCVWYVKNERNISHYLPAENTVAYVKLENLNLPQKLQTYPGWSGEQVENGLRRFFDLDYKAAFSSWGDGKFGVAAVKDSYGKATPLLFIKVQSRRKALLFFQELALPGEQLKKDGTLLTPAYSYPAGQRFSFSFIGPYIFLAPTMENLAPVAETFLGKRKALSDDADYTKTAANLPRKNWMESFVNYKELDFRDPAVRQLTEPLKYVVNNFAFSARQTQSGFHINTLVNLAPGLLSLEENSKGNKFSYGLTDYVGSRGLALYLGGSDLAGEWKNTLESISNLNPAYGLILEGLFRAQVSRIFGDDVDLRNDIYPLLEGEYALTAGQSEKNGMDLRLIIGIENQEFILKKLDKLNRGFRMLAAKFSPRLRVVTLPDGTESRELVADSGRVEERDETYEGYKINCIEVAGTSYGLCYTATERLLILANHYTALKESVDLALKPEFVLSQDQPFRQTLGNLSKVSNEITFMNFQNALPLLIRSAYGPVLEPVLKPFEAATWVKHYFDDGVSAEGYLLVK
ncbi:hypothetical protein JXA05_03905 [Candidatus Peregrinibacteria bacterium]|nr:hypothetical protein [Candidatus Peregrinibacteria bacterium]